MGEEALEFLNRDFSTSIRVLSQINDIWQANVGSLLNEQEQIRRHVKELRDRHRTDQETIDRLRLSNKSLEERLKIANQEKDTLSKKMTDCEERLRNLSVGFDEVCKERNAVLEEIREQHSRLKHLDSAAVEREAELKHVRDELRAAMDTSKALDAQLSRERDEWHTKCHDLEQSALVRMESQKKDMEHRMKEELAATSKRYADAHRKMKADFEEALQVASRQVEDLTAERDKWFAKAQQLHDDMEDYEAGVRQKYQQMIAKNFFTVNAELEKPGDVPKRLTTPPRPLSYAKHFLRESRNRDGGLLRTGSSTASDGENSPPPIRTKLRRYSTNNAARSTVLPSKTTTGTGQQQQQRPSTSTGAGGGAPHVSHAFRRVVPKK